MAAFIPLIGALAPTIINLITSLTTKHATTAETALGSGTGPVKFAQVFNAVLVDLQAAAAAGQIDKILPPDATIQTIIQSTVMSMQLAGLLPSSTVSALGKASATAAPTVTPVSLTSGQSITITAK